uniref:Alternative protein UBR5 n=1 Tax=Homo sapiens TaxID=9606 RepID=L8E894_HUMAN|nr:alternative protein UBR5 [Homo sapiens]
MMKMEMMGMIQPANLICLERILCLSLMPTFILPTQVSLLMQMPCFLKTLAILVTLLFVVHHFPG